MVSESSLTNCQSYNTLCSSFVVHNKQHSTCRVFLTATTQARCDDADKMLSLPRQKMKYAKDFSLIQTCPLGVFAGFRIYSFHSYIQAHAPHESRLFSDSVFESSWCWSQAEFQLHWVLFSVFRELQIGRMHFWLIRNFSQPTAHTLTWWKQSCKLFSSSGAFVLTPPL